MFCDSSLESPPNICPMSFKVTAEVSVQNVVLPRKGKLGRVVPGESLNGGQQARLGTDSERVEISTLNRDLLCEPETSFW